MNSLDDMLIRSGHLYTRARNRRRPSLTRGERVVVERRRKQALDAGYSEYRINFLEMDGERGIGGTSGRGLDCEFAYIEDTGVLGFKRRWYNIVGTHPLGESTVDIMTLVHNRIIPYDISVFQTAIEYVKEWFLLTWSWSAQTLHWVTTLYPSRRSNASKSSRPVFECYGRPLPSPEASVRKGPAGNQSSDAGALSCRSNRPFSWVFSCAYGIINKIPFQPVSRYYHVIVTLMSRNSSRLRKKEESAMKMILILAAVLSLNACEKLTQAKHRGPEAPSSAPYVTGVATGEKDCYSVAALDLSKDFIVKVNGEIVPASWYRYNQKLKWIQFHNKVIEVSERKIIITGEPAIRWGDRYLIETVQR